MFIDLSSNHNTLCLQLFFFVFFFFVHKILVTISLQILSVQLYVSMASTQNLNLLFLCIKLNVTDFWSEIVFGIIIIFFIVYNQTKLYILRQTLLQSNSKRLKKIQNINRALINQRQEKKQWQRATVHAHRGYFVVYHTFSLSFVIVQNLTLRSLVALLPDVF